MHSFVTLFDSDRREDGNDLMMRHTSFLYEQYSAALIIVAVAARQEIAVVNKYKQVMYTPNFKIAHWAGMHDMLASINSLIVLISRPVRIIL